MVTVFSEQNGLFYTCSSTTSNVLLCASHHTGVLTTTDVDEATKGVEIAVMVGGFPRKVRLPRLRGTCSMAMRSGARV